MTEFDRLEMTAVDRMEKSGYLVTNWTSAKKSVWGRIVQWADDSDCVFMTEFDLLRGPCAVDRTIESNYLLTEHRQSSQFEFVFCIELTTVNPDTSETCRLCWRPPVFCFERFDSLCLTFKGSTWQSSQSEFFLLFGIHGQAQTVGTLNRGIQATLLLFNFLRSNCKDWLGDKTAHS